MLSASMNRLKRALATGLLVLVPVLATVGVVRWLVETLDGVVRSLFPSAALPYDFPGLGLFSFLILVLAAGIFAENYLGRAAFGALDGMLRRVAFAGSIYGAIRKLLETVLGSTNDRFAGVVLVPFPRDGMWSIGFRTGAPDKKLSAALPGKLVNVFVPCTPNPTSGFYLIVEEEKLVPLEMTVQEAFRAVLSMGLVTSDESADSAARQGGASPSLR
jgi:uncharacterized membrane protein